VIHPFFGETVVGIDCENDGFGARGRAILCRTMPILIRTRQNLACTGSIHRGRAGLGIVVVEKADGVGIGPRRIGQLRMFERVWYTEELRSWIWLYPEDEAFKDLDHDHGRTPSRSRPRVRCLMAIGTEMLGISLEACQSFSELSLPCHLPDDMCGVKSQATGLYQSPGRLELGVERGTIACSLAYTRQRLGLHQ